MSCTNLNRISKRSTSTMHVEYGDREGCQCGPLQCTGYHSLLCGTIWCCQSRRTSILIDSRSCKAYHRTISVNGLSFTIQQQNATSFSTHVSISICIQGLAPAFKGQHTRLLEYDTSVWRQCQVHTACKRHSAFTQYYTVTSYMRSNQRR